VIVVIIIVRLFCLNGGSSLCHSCDSFGFFMSCSSCLPLSVSRCLGSIPGRSVTSAIRNMSARF
jgi:hypothetical protein